MEGVITFLDILGWKGIYNRSKSPLDLVKEFLVFINSHASEFNENGFYMPKPTILSLSDTIAIVSPIIIREGFEGTIDHHAQYLTGFEEHGKLCSTLIPQSIKLHIPVRGATTIGDFEMGDNVFVGKAIDEVASWYENADWIGVHMTPSAFMRVNVNLKYWKPYKPPLKNNMSFDTFCVDWTNDWEKSNKERKYIDKARIAKLFSDFKEMGPLTPDISSKFINTYKFYLEMQELPYDFFNHGPTWDVSEMINNIHTS